MLELGPVLIANRGEIAVRVARTCRALGLPTVGVFVDADAEGVHVDAVDVAVRIPAYLDGAAIVEAAAKTGARSVHPGLGFVAYTAGCGPAVAEAGLVWIGPPASAIELMGDKGRAKDAASEAGVPVVPSGDDGGYPVVVKAVAGGGGKGMRVVRSEAELAAATESAKREAMSAFGDDRVIVERWIERPRHIEVQVLADRHGAVGHLGERECSLQRRHQKVVEEAPSPVISAAMRAEMGDAAVALAQAAGYEGVGTVEFIATGAGDEFFFLEMNTRLQVEHPVTELVYGVDLVELQLRVAAGEPLPALPSAPTGHAIEARLYAEDPGAGFLPAIGTVRVYAEPPGVRMDSGVRAGSEVGTQFDPMLAKVIAHGPDRATAIGRLDRALAELAVVGVTTNAAFTRTLLARDDVRAGEQDTGLLERILDDVDHSPPDDLLPAAALLSCGTATPPGPWRRVYEDGTVVRISEGVVTVGETTYHAVVHGTDAVELDGVLRRYAVAIEEDDVWIARDGHHLPALAQRATRGAAALAGSLDAPMPGTVLQVLVAEGDEVEEGALLVVLESMKMELSITAPYAGTVEGLSLEEGDKVTLKQPLLAVTPHE